MNPESRTKIRQFPGLIRNQSHLDQKPIRQLVKEYMTYIRL